jgi:hypothetical protein
MSLNETFRALNKRLRTMLLATALLIVPGIGQFMAIRDLNTIGHDSDLAVLFMVVAIFAVPTSLILSSAIIATVRREWRQHQRLVILGILNIIISLNLIWFFFGACSWAQVFGLVLRTCHR